MKDLNFYSRPVWVLFTSLSHSQVTWKIREQVMGRKEALGGRWSLPSQVLASATPSPPKESSQCSRGGCFVDGGVGCPPLVRLAVSSTGYHEQITGLGTVMEL